VLPLKRTKNAAQNIFKNLSKGTGEQKKKKKPKEVENPKT